MSEPLMDTTQRVNEMIDSTELAMHRFTRCMTHLSTRCEHQLQAIADARALNPSFGGLALKNDVLPLLRATAEMHRQAAEWSGAARLGLASRIDSEDANDALESSSSRALCRWHGAIERFRVFERANEECLLTAMECIDTLEDITFDKAASSGAEEAFSRLFARLVK